MQRMSVLICILTVLMGLGMSAFAATPGEPDATISSGVLGTVIALEPARRATIETSDGDMYETVTDTGWQVGDLVQCARSDRQRSHLWKAFDCRKLS